MLMETMQTLYPHLIDQLVKNLPAMQETWVQFLGGEDPLEKEMATHFPVSLPGESHGQRRLEGYSPWGCKELDTTYRLKRERGDLTC